MIESGCMPHTKRIYAPEVLGSWVAAHATLFSKNKMIRKLFSDDFEDSKLRFTIRAVHHCPSMKIAVKIPSPIKVENIFHKRKDEMIRYDCTKETTLHEPCSRQSTKPLKFSNPFSSNFVYKSRHKIVHSAGNA